MAFPWFAWLIWIAVISSPIFSSFATSSTGSSSALITGDCLYQECALNPLSECFFSSDHLIDCETRAACQRIIAYKVIPENPLRELLSLSIHSYSLKPNTSIDLTYNVTYLSGSPREPVAYQSFKCSYFHPDGALSAIMLGYNESQVYGEALLTGESIHCQWIISPESPLWPLSSSDGQPVNLYDHIFTQNSLSVNSSIKYVFTNHRSPLHRLSYLTKKLYPGNGLPFNPCSLRSSTHNNKSQKKLQSQCSGQVIIVPNHQDETYLDIYLVVYDPIVSISLQLKHSSGEQKIGLLRCRYTHWEDVQCTGVSNNNEDSDDPSNNNIINSSTGNNSVNHLSTPSSSSDDYQLGSVEASPLFNSTGLRAFWRVPVSFAQLWSTKGSLGVNFLLDINISLESGEEHTTRGNLRLSLTGEYPSPFDNRKCFLTDSSTLGISSSTLWILLTIVLAQLLDS